MNNSKLDTTSWGSFDLTEFFDIKGSKTTSLNDLYVYGKGKYPYVTTQAINNGVEGFYNWYTEEKNVLTIDSAVIGYCSYREECFSASDHVEILSPNSKLPLNKYIAMFLVTILNMEQYRYSYGRKASQKQLKRTKIKLPITSDRKPDWQYMEDYVRSLKINLPVTSNKSFNISFDFSRWSFFKLSDLFKIKKGKRLTKIDQTVGNTPYIGAIDTNNGLSNTIGQKPIHKGNTISLSYNGSVGEAFFQPVDFWATDDVNVLYPKFKMNQYIALFICTILRKEKIKYSYGRKWTLEQMNSTRIKLPSIDGSPNWQFMEDYIKSLPYGDCL